MYTWFKFQDDMQGLIKMSSFHLSRSDHFSLSSAISLRSLGVRGLDADRCLVPIHSTPWILKHCREQTLSNQEWSLSTAGCYLNPTLPQTEAWGCLVFLLLMQSWRGGTPGPNLWKVSYFSFQQNLEFSFCPHSSKGSKNLSEYLFIHSARYWMEHFHMKISIS